MSFNSRPILFLFAAVLMLTACETQQISRHEILTEPHFWQRTQTSDAIYQRGPKAQQMLNRDIARCVTEIRELERLGAIRHITPAELDEFGIEPPERERVLEMSLDPWETPQRDGYLRAEHLDYHDFESCMMAKGWERIEHVPYSIAEESRDHYIDAVIGEYYQTRHPDYNGDVE